MATSKSPTFFSIALSTVRFIFWSSTIRTRGLEERKVDNGECKIRVPPLTTPPLSTLSFPFSFFTSLTPGSMIVNVEPLPTVDVMVNFPPIASAS